MPDEMSDDELRQLISSTGANQRPSPRPSGFEQTPMAYDFKHPQQVNKEQARVIDSIHEQFARLFSASLASSMRMIIDTELAFADQISYNEFLLSLAAPSTAYSFVVDPPGGGAVLNFAPELVMAIIDRSFGGKGHVSASDPRTLTKIEMNILKKLVARVFTDLEAAWESILPIQISDVALETNPEFIQVAAPSDQVFLLGFEANASSVSGLIHLCYPLHTLDPLLAQIAPRQKAMGQSSLRPRPDAPPPPRGLDKMMVPVAIRVARGDLPLEEVANLQSGDIIKLDTVRGEPAVVFIGNQPKFLGRPGLKGQKRAVEIIREIALEEEDFYR
jgi:flagellar motor switch protein FliM